MIRMYLIKRLTSYTHHPLKVFVEGIIHVICGITQIVTFGIVICNLNIIFIDWIISTRCCIKPNVMIKPFEIGSEWRFTKKETDDAK